MCSHQDLAKINNILENKIKIKKKTVTKKHFHLSNSLGSFVIVTSPNVWLCTIAKSNYQCQLSEIVTDNRYFS